MFGMSLEDECSSLEMYKISGANLWGYRTPKNSQVIHNIPRSKGVEFATSCGMSIVVFQMTLNDNIVINYSEYSFAFKMICCHIKCGHCLFLQRSVSEEYLLRIHLTNGSHPCNSYIDSVLCFFAKSNRLSKWINKSTKTSRFLDTRISKIR